jgi:sialate O-acetylesterase
MTPRRLFLFAIIGLWSPALAMADVKVASIFGDNMVLQRHAPVPVWGAASPGEEIYVTFEQKTADGKREEGKSVIADENGKWMVKIGPFTSGGEPGTLTIKGAEKKDPKDGKNALTFKNVLIGEVWICSGQSNMQWEMYRSTLEPEKNISEASHPQIRLFHVPRQALAAPRSDIVAPKREAKAPFVNIDAKWVECSPDHVRDFSAVAYFFGRELSRHLQVPIGLINTSYGGTPAEAWTSREALLAKENLKHYVESLDASIKNYDPEKAKAAYETAMEKWKKDAEAAKAKKLPIPKQPTLQGRPGTSPNNPSGLYNAMIAPLVPFAIQGAIWYQGESNNGKAFEYRELFPTMIEDWRARWGKEFPFLFVQLAPYWNGNSEGVTYAELRDAQLNTAKVLKNTAMAVITDYGDEKDIHPKQKQPVGERLALAAKALAYGEKTVYSGPVYKAKKVEGDKVILSFDHLGGGLMATGDKLTGFAIADEKGDFVDADAKIVGDTVVVSSPKVAKPTDARYGWKNFMTVNLFNKEGLPATPFRTDDRPYTTMPKKK